jgi:hypothetical protein
MSRNRTNDAGKKAIVAPSLTAFQLELPLQLRRPGLVLAFQKPDPVKAEAAALRRILDFAEKLPGRKK